MIIGENDHGPPLRTRWARREIVSTVDNIAHVESGLEKAVWTDDDLEHLGFHDARIVAIALTGGDDPGPSRLSLDLDYLVQWVHPVAPETTFSFWTAPVTLVFEDVWAVSGELDVDMSINAITRFTEDPGPGWHIDGHMFDLYLTSSAGFTMTVRRPPALTRRQCLTLAERGGISFDEAAFDTRR